MKSFYADLRAFQKKYPMVYVEAWTPEDFTHAADMYGDDHDPEEAPAADWTDPDHVMTANALAEGFDANDGTNWSRVHSALCTFP